MSRVLFFWMDPGYLRCYSFNSTTGEKLNKVRRIRAQSSMAWNGRLFRRKKQTKSDSRAKKLVQYCLIWVILPTKKKICMSHSRTRVSTEINANSCGVLNRIYFFGIRPIWQRTNSSPCRRTRESNKKQFQHSETRLWTSFRVSRSSKTSLQHRSFFFNMPCVWFCKEDFYEKKVKSWSVKNEIKIIFFWSTTTKPSIENKRKREKKKSKLGLKQKRITRHFALQARIRS